ncbi:MAG: ABC transporter substrate-binding protein [Candidatus Bruticola sp.]
MGAIMLAAVIVYFAFTANLPGRKIFFVQDAASGRASLWDDNFKPEGKTRRQRVVSLTPSLTETICALGAEEYLVGVTDNDDYPPSVRSLPSVGDMYPNLELIAAAAPDLIVYDETLLPSGISGRLAKLKGRHLPLRLNSLEDLAKVLDTLGQALDKRQEAAALNRQLSEFLSSCQERNARSLVKPSVFLVIWPCPIMTVGGGSYIDNLITLAGGRNCYADLKAAYPTVSIEDLLQRDPDLIIMNCEGAPDITKMAGWSSLKAVQAGRVYHVPASLLHRSTMRSLRGVELLRHYCEVAHDN